MLIHRVIVITLATVALVTPSLCFAQSERGTITGVIEVRVDNFGLITSASSPRQMQLGLKLYW